MKEPKLKVAYESTCEECGCDYITVITYKPGFKDIVPKCPCCDGKGN